MKLQKLGASQTQIRSALRVSHDFCLILDVIGHLGISNIVC